MPVNQIVDPQAESTETFEAAIQTAVFQATGAISKGMAVVLVTETVVAPGSPLKCKKSTTTASFLLIGIAKTAAVSGTLVTVIVNGPAKALCKTDSVKNEAVLVTGTTAGYVKTTATAVLGKTLGASITTTTSTTTHFIYVYVNRM